MKGAIVVTDLNSIFICMKEEIKWEYSNVVYLLSLVLILGSFISIQDKFDKSLFDFFFHLLTFSTITLGFLWKRSRLMFIGLILYLIHWNINLLIFPLFQVKSEFILELNLYQYNKVILVVGVMCFTIALFDWIKNDYLKEQVRISETNLIYLLTGITIVIQGLIRF